MLQTNLEWYAFLTRLGVINALGCFNTLLIFVLL